MEFLKYLLIGVSVSLDELAMGTVKGVQIKHMRRVDPWVPDCISPCSKASCSSSASSARVCSRKARAQ